MNAVNKSLTISIAVSILLFLTALNPVNSQAQTGKLIAFNTGAGALTGSALAGASMLLANEANSNYLRFGIGLGTIAGLGIGVYDVIQVGGSSSYYVSGLVSSGSNTMSIIMLDTGYGAATGAIVGMAVALMTADPILNGLQYGTGVGAWVGFAFGIADAFIFGSSQGSGSFFDDIGSNYVPVRGLVQYQSERNFAIGALNPTIYQSQSFYPISAGNSLVTGLEIANFNIRF